MSTDNSDSIIPIDSSSLGRSKSQTRRKSRRISKKKSDINKEVNDMADKITPYILEKIYSIIGPSLDVKVMPYVLLLYVDFKDIKKKSPLKQIPQIKEMVPGKDNVDLGMVNGIFGVNSKRNYIIQLVYQEYCSKMFDTKEIETFISSNNDEIPFVCTNYIFDMLLREYPDRKKDFDFPIKQLVTIFAWENRDDPVLDINSK